MKEEHVYINTSSMNLQEALTIVMPKFHYSFEGSYPKEYEAWQIIKALVFAQMSNNITKED